MVSFGRLVELAEERDGWVVVDPWGQVVDLSLPKGMAPATLLVAPVTEALKRVSEEGMVIGAIDRDQVWEVAAFALSHHALRRLDGEFTSAHHLYRAVNEAGLVWQARPLRS